MEKAYGLEHVLFPMVSPCWRNKQCISQFTRDVFQICTGNSCGKHTMETRFKTVGVTNSDILYSYFMPVCSIVKSITLRCRGRPDALLHEVVHGTEG